MAQQINLYDASLRPRRDGWRAVHAAWMMGATLAVTLGLWRGLDIWAGQRTAQAEALERQVAVQRAALDARRLGTSDKTRQRGAEIERLRALEAGQSRVRGMLDAQTVGQTNGYTPYFIALSHQARGPLWITGFSVSEDGHALELQGRMSDAAALPDYLRRLNAEPQFKGRRFAQLTMKAAEGYTEFVLRSLPPDGGASR